MSVALLSTLLASLTLCCMGLVYLALRQTTTTFPPAQQQRFHSMTGLGLSSWLLILALLAGSGFFAQFDQLPPRLPFFVMTPVVVLVLLLRRPAVQDWLRQVPLSYLLGIQSFRLLVELLLWGMALAGALPERLTFEGWNFDVFIGITAPLMAWGAAQQRLSHGLLVGWNVLGIGLLMVVASLGFLSMPSPFRVFLEDDVRVLAHFPWVWLPTVLVALGYYAHVFALWKLWQKR